MRLLDGKTAVVTGGARGIGLAIARRLSAEGAAVALADLDAERAGAAAAELSGPSFGVSCDVTEPDPVESMIQRAQEELGPLDIMVNNAGFTRDATIRRMPLEDFDAVVAVHLRGTWICTKAASSAMRDRESAGAIVNISSISGKVGNAGQTNYSAAKAGIVGMTKAAAKELGHTGIRVNAIQPGLIRTEMTAQMPAPVLESRAAEIPLGRLGEADEVAKVALFLASDLASYVTGAVIEVAGGRHI